MDVFNGLPGHVKVGAFVYRILVVPDDAPELQNADGLTDLNLFRVYVRAGLTQRAIEIVLHELSHCVAWVYGLPARAAEETFVTLNARGQAELFLRNPELLGWLLTANLKLRKSANKS